MQTLLTWLAVVFRVFRPSRGLHAAPRAVREDVREEARAARVRRYSHPTPARPSGPGYDFHPIHGCASVVDPREVNPQANVVRPYFEAWERTREAAYADRQRLGVAVAMDVARVAERAA